MPVTVPTFVPGGDRFDLGRIDERARVLRVGLGIRDLGNTRFAVSPLWEAVASVRIVKNPHRFPVHLPWAERTRRQLTAVDWRLLADLVPVPTVVIPSFVCPPPVISRPTLDLELTALAATPPDVVRASLDGQPEPRSPRLAALYADPRAELPRLTEVIRAYFEAAVAPYWPRMSTLLEREVLVGAQRMAVDGVQGLLNRVDPHVHLDDDTLHVDLITKSGTVQLDGRGLLLVPTVFGWPRIFTNLGTSGQSVLRYPASAVATLWERSPRSPGAALSRVLGRTRAELLHELAVPASTTELAQRCSLTAGTVSQHLTALRDAGLVTPYRVGRFLLYARTAAAEALLSPTVGS